MLGLQDAQGIYRLPTGWHEVTTAQYCWLAAPDRFLSAEVVASYFAGRPIQVNALVAAALDWRLQEPPDDGGLPFPDDLGQETFMQVELLRRAVMERPLHESYGTAYGLFTQRTKALHNKALFHREHAQAIGVACLAWPVTDTYPAIKHCLSELHRLSEKYSKLATSCSCEECGHAEAAGAARFEGFSYYNTLKSYAAYYHITVDEAGQTPYDTVALHLLHERMAHEFQVDLRRQTQQSE